MLDLQRLFNDPDQYLFSFEGEDAIFASMDRDAYHRSIFSDRRLAPKTAAIEKIAIASLLDAQAKAAAAPADISYIFHIAHCGSTLLARALDINDATLVCRGPVAVRQLGVMAAKSYPEIDDAWAKRANLAATLLSRRYNSRAPVIVKANVPVNFMIEPLMQMRPEQPAILLHF